MYLLVITIFLFSCTSNEKKIANGNLEGVAFYDPSFKQTLKFRDTWVKHKTWSGYPKSDYTTMLNEEDLGYSYDKNTKTGLINGQKFTINRTGTNKNSYYLTYLGSYYVHEELFSDDPNKTITNIFLIIFVVSCIYFLYRLYKKGNSEDFKKKQRENLGKLQSRNLNTGVDKTQQLLNLQKLKNDGVITTEEFEIQKKEILGS
jgi:hypothetical protein